MTSIEVIKSLRENNSKTKKMLLKLHYMKKILAMKTSINDVSSTSLFSRPTPEVDTNGLVGRNLLQCKECVKCLRARTVKALDGFEGDSSFLKFIYSIRDDAIEEIFN